MPASPLPFDAAAAAGLAVSAAVALLLPFLLGHLWRRRSGARWGSFGAGALVFFVSQVVLRFPWQIPLGKYMFAHYSGQEPAWSIFLLSAALTAGIFEELGRYVGYRTLLKREQTPRAAVMFGLGHGGIEAILIVGLSLAGLLIAWALASVGRLPAGPALEAIRAQVTGLTFAKGLLAGVERISAMAVQVGLSLIVLQAFARRRFRWVLLAIGLHFVVDAVAVLLLKRIGAYQTEILIGAMGAATLSLGWWLSRSPENRSITSPAPAA